ncbi:hypothetical protein E4T47_02469 [Aureobasidium subglaciale]|nr:hypothetical protein E4T47_02469 [Aureobasidium subglaciale]
MMQKSTTKENKPLDSFRFVLNGKGKAITVTETAAQVTNKQETKAAKPKRALSHTLKRMLSHSSLSTVITPDIASMPDDKPIEEHAFRAKQAHTYLKEMMRRRASASAPWNTPKSWHSTGRTSGKHLSSTVVPELRDVSLLVSNIEGPSLQVAARTVERDTVSARSAKWSTRLGGDINMNERSTTTVQDSFKLSKALHTIDNEAQGMFEDDLELVRLLDDSVLHVQVEARWRVETNHLYLNLRMATTLEPTPLHPHREGSSQASDFDREEARDETKQPADKAKQSKLQAEENAEPQSSVGNGADDADDDHYPPAYVEADNYSDNLDVTKIKSPVVENQQTDWSAMVRD